MSLLTEHSQKKDSDHSILMLYTLTSVCIFFTVFPIHFSRCWRGEIPPKKTRASLVCDHFILETLINVWFRGGVMRRNKMLVALKFQKVREDGLVNVITNKYQSYRKLTSKNKQKEQNQSALWANSWIDKWLTWYFGLCLMLSSLGNFVVDCHI